MATTKPNEAEQPEQEQPEEEQPEETGESGNTAVPHEGDHDRVQMLSLRADGTPDQHNPEFIGDAETTLAATAEQFKQQAVSAVDVRDASGGTTVQDAPQDPVIAQAQAEQEKAAQAAEAAAEAAVAALAKG